MRCDEFRARVRALPNADAGKLPAEMREHLAGCRACRSRLAALRLVERGKGLRVQPPAHLVEAIREGVRGAAPVGRGRRPRIFARSLGSARWAGLAAAAAAIVVAASIVFGGLAAGHPSSEEAVRVHLTLDAPWASRVMVVGDWNNWNPKAQPMTNREGRWEIDLELTPGRNYQYQFLVDGTRWIPDPSAPLKVDNGFGGENSVLAS